MLALVSQGGNAHAWGDEGHRIVYEIAFRLAQPDTRSAVRKLIRSDTEFDTFSESCVFPDHPRKRASEHFHQFGAQFARPDCGRLSASGGVRTQRHFERQQDPSVKIREKRPTGCSR
jgi:hypothetical protein